jgi:hypothetical protein
VSVGVLLAVLAAMANAEQAKIKALRTLERQFDEIRVVPSTADARVALTR